MASSLNLIGLKASLQTLFSVPVIRVTRQDLLRPIELFGQHAPHHQMGPGHPAEGQDQVSAGPHCIVQPVRAANKERDTTLPIVPPRPNSGSEFPAGCGFPGFIQRNDDSARRDLFE
jgi:hypothetical protein